MANMVEGGATPLAGAAELEAMGFALVIFPGGIVRAIARTAEDYYRSLREHGSNEPFRERMHDFASLNAVLGTDAMLEEGARYASDRGVSDGSGGTAGSDGTTGGGPSG